MKREERRPKSARKLSRAELLELLIKESEKVEQLERELKEAREKLASRELKINNVGSLAEASVMLSGVFEAAEEACAIYRENLERMERERAQIKAELEADVREKTKMIMGTAEEYAKLLKDAAREQCEKLLESAETRF